MTSQTRFTTPLLLQRKLDGTTGHGLNKGTSIRYARRTMITSLANHGKSRSNDTSGNTMTRRYRDGEAWSSDSQSYAPEFGLLTHATTFVEHGTGYAWAACLTRKNAATMAQAVKALQAHVYRCKHRSVRYLWTGSDPTTLSKSFTDFLTGEGILFGVSPPYQHDKND
jgi:hypothetical protein